MTNVTFDAIIERLRSFEVPEGWNGDLFLLPPECMRSMYDLIIQYKLTSCLELGTGFGATACIITSALERIGQGKLITVDRVLHNPVNVNVLLDHASINRDHIEVVVDELGYNWYLADVLSQQIKSNSGLDTEIFDLCFIDGAHEWETDALAYFLSLKLLKPGGWMVLDDLDFRLRTLDQRPEYKDKSQRELDTYQVRMIFDLLLVNHTDFGQILVYPDQRMVWARKLRSIHSPLGWIDRIKRLGEASAAKLHSLRT